MNEKLTELQTRMLSLVDDELITEEYDSEDKRDEIKKLLKELPKTPKNDVESLNFHFISGYNKAIKDVLKILNKSPELDYKDVAYKASLWDHYKKNK